MPSPLLNVPKGERWPGSGRRKGTPNKISVEVRDLVGQLVNDPRYQAKLRDDFCARKVHPMIEAMLWAYHLGKPMQRVELDAAVGISARIEEERKVYAELELADLEQLAADSQALVDRAFALSRRRREGTFAPENHDAERKPTELLGIVSGSDNTRYVNCPADSDSQPVTDAEQSTYPAAQTSPAHRTLLHDAPAALARSIASPAAAGDQLASRDDDEAGGGGDDDERDPQPRGAPPRCRAER